MTVTTCSDHWSNSPVSLKISHIEQMLTAFHSIKASAQDLAEGQDEGKQSRRSHSEKLEHVRTLLDSTKTALLQALKAQERKSERGVEILVTKSSSITKTLEQQQIALEELQVIVEENQKSLKEISRAESAATDDPNRKSSPAVAIPSTLSLAYAILVPLITGLTTAAATIPFSAKPSIPRSDRIPQAAPATESPNGLNTPRSKLPVIVTYGDDQLRDKQSSIRQAPKPVREDPASICDRQLQKSPSHARKNCPQLQGKSKDSCNGGSEWFLECPFWFLDCMFATLDQEKWMAHSFIHFGPISPPKRTQCPVQNCEEKFHSTNEDRPRVWTLRMHHVAQHYQTAKDTPKWKPDYKLSKYLWRKRLISTEIYDELRCNWNGEFAPSAYLQSSGLAEERRARGMWLDAVRRRVEEARCVRNSTIGGACRIDQCIIIDGKENLDDNSTIRGENDEGDEDSRDSDSDDDTCVGSNDGDSELTEPNKKQGDPSNQDKKPDKDADFGKDVGKGFRPRPLLPSKLEYEKTGRISEDIVKYERYTLVEAKVMAYLRQDMIDFKDATSPQNWMRTYYV